MIETDFFVFCIKYGRKLFATPLVAKNESDGM